MHRRHFMEALSGPALAPLVAQQGAASPATAPKRAMRAAWEPFSFGGVDGQALVADVGQPWRLVAWEKAQYVPCWEIEKGKLWLYTEWLETGGSAARQFGSFEPMADHRNRYTHVEVTELGPARVVLRWEYKVLNRKSKRIFHGNTRAEEIYTVYPDGVTVRKVTAYPGNQAPVEGQPVVWEVAEIGLIGAPGNTLEGIVNLDVALRVSSPDGQTHPVTWPAQNGRFDYPRGPAEFLCKRSPQSSDWSAYVWRPGLRDLPEPFIVVPNRKDYFPTKECPVCGGNHPSFLVRTGPRYNRDWPGCAGEDCPLPRPIDKEETRPKLPMGHMAMVSIIPWVHPSWLTRDYASVRFDPEWNPAPGMSWLMLQATTRKDDKHVNALARQWVDPVELKVTDGKNAWFDPAENLYRVLPGRAGCVFRLNASPEARVIHPAFRVVGWGNGSAQLTLNGARLPESAWRATWTEGDLIVWIGEELKAPSEIRIETF